MQHPTEAQHKQDATAANATREPSGSNNVVISLSREYGSGGRQIGQRVARGSAIPTTTKCCSSA